MDRAPSTTVRNFLNVQIRVIAGWSKGLCFKVGTSESASFPFKALRTDTENPCAMAGVVVKESDLIFLVEEEE